jgi:hypothetical protein
MKAFLLLTLFTIAAIFLMFDSDDFHRHKSKHGHSTTTHQCKDSLVVMSAELEGYFDSFVTECKIRGINYDHLYCLDEVYKGDLNRLQGLTDFNNCSITIDSSLLQDTLGTKFVMYHELGHWMGLEHGEGIMKANYNTNDDYEWVLANWDQLVEDHFNKLKEIKQ